MKRASPTILILISVGVFTLACVLYAQNTATKHYWNQFRGPNGDGKVTATDLPIEFSETENVRWKVPIHDKGYASPVVWGNQIMVNEGGVVSCVDAKNGALVRTLEEELCFSQNGI